MTLSAYLIDDEKHALDLLETYVHRTPGLTLAGSSTNPLLALEELTRATASVDLVFMDIDMPELNGLELAGLLSAGQQVIFTTSFREYGPEAYALSAQDYLLKPVSYERFLRCIQKVRHAAAALTPAGHPDDSFFVKTGNKGSLQKVRPVEIIYIEAALNYMHIKTTAATIITYASIQELLERLPGSYFVRVHKSFIVNTRRISALEHGHIKMDDRSAIPLGRAFREKFFQAVPGLNSFP